MLDLQKPVRLASAEFTTDLFQNLEILRNHKPVFPARIATLRIIGVCRYNDCVSVLKHPDIVRNRATATGSKRRAPFPVPKSLEALMVSMIVEDEPNHRRLRDLVRHAFRPQAITALAAQVDAVCIEILDRLPRGVPIDLQAAFALPVPTRMIASMMGVSAEDMPALQTSLRTLTSGLSGWRILRSLFIDLPQSAEFIRQLIEKKRHNPGNDILSDLIHAEHEGDQLSEDELLAMTFLLIVAGFETTVHLISNSVLTLLDHPDQMARLLEHPALIDSAVEEVLRHRGPIQTTKPGYAANDLEVGGVHIPRGSAIMPMFGAANHDPEVFDNPQQFDIARTPNRHLGFGHGPHFCLGAHLARLETRSALARLLERYPHIRLAEPRERLQPQAMPGWYRYARVPVVL